MKRDDRGRFKTGNNGGPGRPPGSRNSFGEEFLSAVQEDFRKHGKAILAKVRTNSPASYLRVVASLIPRDISVHVPDDFSYLTDAELVAQMLQSLRNLASDLAPTCPGSARLVGQFVNGRNEH